MRRTLALTLALFALLYIVARIRYAPPAAVDAPPERFSAVRAREVQTRLVGDGATRYVGTPGNARGREVIVTELTKLGWAVETQHAWACTHHGMCAPVDNIVARLPGRDPTLPGVLLSAHHDSVPVSAGANDDGLGTATVLETARALKHGQGPRRTFVILLSDGEEAGLLGASAFVRDHPLARTVRATINLDARGSRGPSQMFETSSGNAWLVTLLAGHLERPSTTSLFYEVYKRMPNDTDFSLTKTIASGVNFANIAGIEDYHTTLDTLAVSDSGTLQHHGDNALAMARAFDAADLGGAGAALQGDAVWFDVLSLGVVRWPASWSLLLALIGVALVIGHGLRSRAFDRGLFVFLPAFLAGLVASLLAGMLLRAIGALPAPFIAYPLPALAALNLAASAGALAIVLLFARRSTPRALWTGVWGAWGLLGVACAVVAPGASYLFIVPTLVAALSASVSFPVACVAPAITAATLVLALATGLYDALGLMAPPIVAVPSLLLAPTLAPMLLASNATAERRAPLVLGALAIVSLVVAAVVPKFTASVPQRANVVFRQDEKTARVFVDTTWGHATWGQAPPSMLAAIGGPLLSSESSVPWAFPSLSAEVPRVELSPPVAEVVSVADEGGHHRLRLRVRSQRNAPTLALVLPPQPRVEVKVEGRFAIPRSIAAGSMVGLLAVPAEGVVVELDAAATGKLHFTLLDRSFGVVPGTKAEAAVRARPAEATPSQDGDVTAVTTELSL